MKLQKVLSFVYVSICFLGCSYQLIEVFKSYFTFNVISRVIIEFPSEINIPAFTSCFRYADILDLKEFNSKYHQKIRRQEKGIVSDHDSRIVESAITKRDLFKMTPSEKLEIITRCVFRSEKDYSVYKLNQTACHELFKISRFGIGEFICFMVEPEKVIKFSKERLSSSLSFPNVIYLVAFDWKYFNTSNYMKLVVHSTGNPPFTSIGLVDGFWRKTKSKVIQDVTCFEMDYTIVSLQLLPYPYTTDCKNYSKSGCLKNCSKILSVQQLKKLPFHTIGTDPKKNPQFTFINLNDIANETFVKEFTRIESECSKICFKPSCKVDFSLTNSVKTHAKDLKFEVDVPLDPFVDIESIPHMVFNDFLILSLSLLGFWLGVSISNLNPKLYPGFIEKIFGRNRSQNNSKKSKRIGLKSNKVDPRNNSILSDLFCLETRIFLRERADDEICIILTTLSGPSVSKPSPLIR